MTSSPHGPYGLGYTRATMAVTAGSEWGDPERIPKGRLSSDCTLQLECMKSESLVIADQHAAVNTFPGWCVQGPGTYSPQYADLRLLAIPRSCRRVAECNPN